MRRGEFLLMMALLTITSSFAKGSSFGGSDSPEAPKPPARKESSAVATSATEMIASRSTTGNKELDAAYFSTLRILSSSNECSAFFGGAVSSVEVFNQLFGQVQKDHVRAAIGIQMTGKTTNFNNLKTNTRYRLFDKVIINADGPFFRKQSFDQRFGAVGSFDANTNEARVLMLLHELGHVMKGDDGDWLLPDDGKDDLLSRMNSKKVEAVCGRQISALGKQGRNESQPSLAGKVETTGSNKGDQLTAAKGKSMEPTSPIPTLKKN